MALDQAEFDLIDTPGFNDTFRSEQDILNELAEWLSSTYAAGAKLTGIVYLHPIYAARLEGSARLNLCAFRKLCGMHAFEHITLCTTFWDTVSEAEGAQRESELCATSEFWGDMISRGAHYERIQNYPSSGRLLLRMAERQPVTLTIQKEIVDAKKNLLETEAGQALRDGAAELEQQMQQQIAERKQQLASLQAQKQRQREQQAERLRLAHASFQESQRACEAAQRKELQRVQQKIAEAEEKAKIALESEKQRAAELKRENEKMAAEAKRMREQREEEQRRAEQQRAQFLEREQRAKCRSAREHFQVQVRTLHEARSMGTVKANVVASSRQSPAFLRFCDGCLLMIGWRAATFYSEYLNCSP